ncbi:MAG: insulinase family protein [Deltaproteobacteria bacterium]|nr:insulinase family protein [Deltaproteobacteria bacterium]
MAGIPPGAHERKPMPPPPELHGIKILLVDKPDRTQTQVLMGRPSLSWKDPDLFPVLVGNTAFGGTFTSRLMREIREKRGWSYGVSSFITAGREFGTMAIRFFPANKDTVPAIRLTLDLLKDLVKKGLKDEETSYAENHIANQFPFRLETARKRAGEKLADELYSRPRNYIRDYVKNVRAQDTRTINAAMAKWFDPQGLAVVVVGSAKDLLDGLKKIPGVTGVEVHPYDVDMLPATPADR